MTAKTLNHGKWIKDVLLWGYYTGLWGVLGLAVLLTAV